MSITPTKKARVRAIALVPFVSLGLLGGSVAVAAPAQAEISRYGCTVDALEPRDLRGNRVDFRIKVDCDGKKTIQIRQQRYEDERGPRRTDDFLGATRFTEEFKKHDGSRTINSVDRVRNLDKRGSEEVYHIVSFRVKKDNGDWTDWTKWDQSKTVTVHRGR